MTQGREEKKFNKIKESISNETKIVLDEIWIYHFESESSRDWILTSRLSYKFGKEVIAEILSSLNTSVLKEISDNGRKKCYLTFLGMLLTTYGEGFIDSFINYLSVIQRNLRGDLEFAKIKSDDVYKHLNFVEEEQKKIFTKLLWASHFKDGGGGSGNNWEFGITSVMENELALEENLREFFFRHVFEYLDEKNPASFEEREKSYKPQKEKSSFWFIKDKKLRELIENDWNEINSIFYAQAWKSSIILCGSVLEGLLINELKPNIQNANQEYQTLKSKTAPVLEKWDLADLVEVASKLQLFPKGTIHLTHAVREFRNLVHPGKLLREHIKVTEEQAVIAFNAVKDFQKSKNK